MKISEIFWKKDEYQPSSKGFENVGENYGPASFSVVVNNQEYKYKEEEMEEEDVRKIWHIVSDSKGREYTMDWSPYQSPSEQEVKLWIRLGMPGRITSGPLTHNDLIKIARQKGIQLKRG